MDLTKLPKTELHLHLEGAIPARLQVDLFHKYGLEFAFTTFDYQGLDGFLGEWRQRIAALREYDDFRRIAAAVRAELSAQAVWYAELHFSPPTFLRRGLSFRRLVSAIRAGLDDVPCAQTEVNLIIDLVREAGPDLGETLLDEIAGIRSDAGIVAIGLGGAEHQFPPDPFERIFHRAQALGLHRTVHAGETAGPTSVWSAVEKLAAERIGHGVRASEDGRLVELLRERRILVEVCLTSNQRLGVVDSLANHPAAELFRRGVPITLSSDDPSYFDTNVTREYEIARDVLGFSNSELIAIARAGFEFAFLSPGKKAQMLERFDTTVKPELSSEELDRPSAGASPAGLSALSEARTNSCRRAEDPLLERNS